VSETTRIPLSFPSFPRINTFFGPSLFRVFCNRLPIRYHVGFQAVTAVGKSPTSGWPFF
jgi:hypothetical protein